MEIWYAQLNIDWDLGFEGLLSDVRRIDSWSMLLKAKIYDLESMGFVNEELMSTDFKDTVINKRSTKDLLIIDDVDFKKAYGNRFRNFWKLDFEKTKNGYYSKG